ncbi:UNVERIFIED_CONTAM: hypothetical protein HDU68_002176 [Siphonaria sp. JEL0065]|nr:hypothetical protein HDU68_002176 [Siphonaria sp. JEL0065]
MVPNATFPVNITARKMSPIPETRFWVYSLALTGVYYYLGVLLPVVIGSFCLINDVFYLVVIALGASAQPKLVASAGSKTLQKGSTDAKPANYGYVTYTLYEPLMLSSFNALGSLIAGKFGIEGPSRYLVIWAFAHTIVIPMVIFGGFYKFTKLSEWVAYFSKQVVLYGFVINVLCQGAEYLVLQEIHKVRKLA